MKEERIDEYSEASVVSLELREGCKKVTTEEMAFHSARRQASAKVNREEGGGFVVATNDHVNNTLNILSLD